MQSIMNQKKRLIIIGGGVSGLSAGIYGQRAGFDTIILEKNMVAGGNCSGWYRNGYAIDNCLHWLTGTKENTEVYNMWEELGVLGPDVKQITRDCFWASETDGVVVTLWPDAEKTRTEWLSISPEDATEINAFFDCVRLAGEALVKPVNPKSIAQTVSTQRTVLPHREFTKKSMQYLGLRNTMWASKFKSKAIRNLILDFCPKEYESYWLILAYSFYVTGNGNIIEGGSIKMAQSLIDTYKKEHGDLRLGCIAKKIVLGREKMKISELVKESISETFSGGVSVEAAKEASSEIAEISKEVACELKEEIKEGIVRKAKGVVLENGEVLEADYIICACDIYHTFSNLLNKRYAPLSLNEVVTNRANYTFYSAFQVAFAVKGEFSEVPDSLSFDCEPIDAAYETYGRIGVKNYRKYGDYIAPKGETVIQVSLDQYKKDCRYWRKLYNKDQKEYIQAKENVAAAILNAIEKKFPQYEGKLTLLDIWTPYSYERRNNASHGAFMRFITTAFSVNAFLSLEIKGLDNVYLSGHWLRYPGGVPMAASTGKEAVELIKEKEEKRAMGISALIPWAKKINSKNEDNVTLT